MLRPGAVVVVLVVVVGAAGADAVDVWAAIFLGRPSQPVVSRISEQQHSVARKPDTLTQPTHDN